MSPAEAPIDLPALLQAAVQALQGDDLAAAQAALLAVLAADPAQPDALHFQGLVLHRGGDTLAGLRSMRRALALQPANTALRLNLGHVLLESGQTLAAVDAYRALLADEPAVAAAWCHLGLALQGLGRPADALQAWQRAVQLDADLAEAWYGLAALFIEAGELQAGLRAHARAVALQPAALQPRERVMQALLLHGHRAEAVQLYRDWLAAEPGHAVAQHQLAAALGSHPPARASDAYLQAVFDSAALQFDRQLAALAYQGPQQVAQAVAAWAGPAQLDVADIGCGTGLCGPLLRPWARRLVGCDVSAGMLAQARRRGGYDQLLQAEAVDFLQQRPAAFDLIVAADTLCYFGPLDRLFGAAAQALCAGGALIFTTEALHGDSEPFILQPSGRYAHGAGYLHVGLQRVGMTAEVSGLPSLRHEAGQSVAGWIATAIQGSR